MVIYIVLSSFYGHIIFFLVKVKFLVAKNEGKCYLALEEFFYSWFKEKINSPNFQEEKKTM